MSFEVGYALSSEEHPPPHPPTELVRHAVRAEQAGFSLAGISDHFHPWTDSQGHSPMVWPVVQSHHGPHYTVENARISTLPEELPPIVEAAAGTKVAEQAAQMVSPVDLDTLPLGPTRNGTRRASATTSGRPRPRLRPPDRRRPGGVLPIRRARRPLPAVPSTTHRAHPRGDPHA